jgi:Flp pilus assembly protein TadG
MNMGNRKGNSAIEFTLIAIPLLFVQFSLVEICRCMWDYHSLAAAVKIASRTAATRGAGCAGQGCALTIDQVARVVASYSGGMPSNVVSVTLTSNAGSVNCDPLNTCFGNAAVWPPAGGNTVGSDIVIAATYPFTSMVSMFIPGKGGMRFTDVTFRAQSRQTLLF